MSRFQQQGERIEGWVRRRLRPAAAAMRRAGRWFLQLPRLVHVALVCAAGSLAFIAVVLPLFKVGGPARAEIAGQIPPQGHGQVSIDVALDNVGDAIIYPVCIGLSPGDATLVSAVFQGLDHVTARDNRVCGGQLTAQETISVVVVIRLPPSGPVALTLTPMQGDRPIGAPLIGSLTAS